MHDFEKIAYDAGVYQAQAELLTKLGFGLDDLESAYSSMGGSMPEAGSHSDQMGDWMAETLPSPSAMGTQVRNMGGGIASAANSLYDGTRGLARRLPGRVSNAYNSMIDAGADEFRSLLGNDRYRGGVSKGRPGPGYTYNQNLGNMAYQQGRIGNSNAHQALAASQRAVSVMPGGSEVFNAPRTMLRPERWQPAINDIRSMSAVNNIRAAMMRNQQRRDGTRAPFAGYPKAPPAPVVMSSPDDPQMSPYRELPPAQSSFSSSQAPMYSESYE
jgi:hypothetical protein